MGEEAERFLKEDYRMVFRPHLFMFFPFPIEHVYALGKDVQLRVQCGDP